jgi:AAA family ATP:ADP antiporter
MASVTSEPRTLVSHPELASHHSFPAFKTLGEARKTPLDRLLSFFADVRTGEGVGALVLALNVFLLLAAYSMLKPARDALVVAEQGSVGKAWASGTQALLLMGIVPMYGWLSTRVPRLRLIGITTLVIVSNLLLFAVAAGSGTRVGIAFFIWLGLINMFVVSQFWAFANDLYTEGQGRRLFPMIGVGQSLGALAGVAAVPALISGFGFQAHSLMLLSAPIFLVSFVLTVLASRVQPRQADGSDAKIDAAPLSKEGGFELILKDRYLFWIAMLTIVLNVVNTTGGFVFDSLVAAEMNARFGADAATPGRTEFATSVYGVFGTTVNLVGLLLQLFVTSRVMRYMGVRGALFILPVLAFVNYSIMAVAPVLAVVRLGKVLENSTDYSIQNTVRQALFLPTSREAKYKAKAAIDTFCARVGDLAASGVFVIGSTVGFAVTSFAWINVLIAAVWIAVAGRIAREHRKKTV